MNSVFDKGKLRIECPECTKSFTETIGKLKTSPKIKCRYCGITISIDAKDLVRDLRTVDKEFKGLEKSIADLNKTFKF